MSSIPFSMPLSRMLCLILLATVVFAGNTSISACQETDNSEMVDYFFQGEYSGELVFEQLTRKVGLHVIALGNSKFAAVGYAGGLPGDGWNGERLQLETNGESKLVDDILSIPFHLGTVRITDQIASVTNVEGETIGKLKRVIRKSPTLGKKPPADGRFLFDGPSSVSNWDFKGRPGSVNEEGLLQPGTASKEKFQDTFIHIDFLLPYEPTKRGQARGNSGIYVQGRYEVQMLDSFGLLGENNECGGIYSIRKPDLNMCFPPMQWQTYDIVFEAAKFDAGKKTANARMTVFHNGVKIHNRVELPQATTAAPLAEGPEPGFIYLQDHGSEVRYRNIWVAPLETANEILADSAAQGDSVVTKGTNSKATSETQTTSAKQKSNARQAQTVERLDVAHRVQLNYLLSLPEGYEEQDKWPLLLFLHGAGERGTEIDKVKVHGPPKLLASGREFPFIVVSPQCPESRWWEPVSLTALLDDIEKKYKVDQDRIYITGLSMGGFGTWALAAHSPNRFAAIAPVCGGGDRTVIPYMIGDRVPIWCFHGAKDNVVPLSRSQELIDGLKKAGVETKFTIYPEAGHDSWTETYNNDELYQWLLQHKRKPAGKDEKDDQ